MVFYDRVTALVDKQRVTDLCKAFDTVPHNILVSKTERQGFERLTTWWIKNWLDGHAQRAQQASGDQWCPQCLALRAAPLNREVDSKIEGTLRNFADDTRLCGAVNMLEGRDAIQRLERLCECHEVQQGQVQDPVPGLGQCQTQIQSGWRMNWEQPWGEALIGGSKERWLADLGRWFSLSTPPS